MITCPYCGTNQIQVVKHSLGREQYHCRECHAASPVFEEKNREQIAFWTIPKTAEVILEGGMLDAVDVPHGIEVKLYDLDVLEEDFNGETPSGRPCAVVYL